MSKPVAPRLGRGLNALIRKPIPPNQAAAAATQHPPASSRLQAIPGASNGDIATAAMIAHAPGHERAGSLRELPLGSITPNPHQPRSTFSEARLAELANSLKQSGVLQPIVVRPVGPNAFQLIAGERRWRAAQRAGLLTIPAIVRDVTDAQSVEFALVENLQREDLAPLERATAYQRYMESFGVGADDLALRLGESRANVSNYVRLLRLPDEVQELLKIGELGMGQARAIAAATDPRRQLALARLAVRRNLSVRQVEGLVKSAFNGEGALGDELGTSGTTEPGAEATSNRHTAELASRFSRAIGMPVRVLAGKKKNAGRIVIQYNSLEDFDRLCDRLGVPAAE